MKKKLIITTIIIATAVAVVIGGFYYNIFASNAIKSEGEVFINSGAELINVWDIMNGNVVSSDKLKLTAKILRFKNVKPGRYILKNGMSYAQVVRMLRAGEQTPVKITFNNVRTLEQLAQKLSLNIEPDSADMYHALSNDSLQKKFGFNNQTFISMFIPNTYEVYWNCSTEDIITKMNSEHNKFWNSNRLSKLEKVGLSKIEVYTLASIVYEETKMSNEMATVAGVYINRIKRGIPLQADPTVKFAIGDFAIRRVLNRHLEIDSPYNTYKYSGLPPGPICMPTISAIEAVLNYTKHKYIYFCAAADMSGYHKFATSLAEHNRNAREYANALNRLKIFK